MVLPLLPYNNTTWSAQVLAGVKSLTDIHEQAISSLQIYADKHRLVLSASAIADRAIPLLQALADSNEGIPRAWVEGCIEALAGVFNQLEKAIHREDGSEQTNISIPANDMVRVVHTGRPGRPRKVPNPQFLESAMNPSSNLSQVTIAQSMKMHRNTLASYLTVYNIDTAFTTISDNELDRLVVTFRQERPDSGLRYLMGHMRSNGIRVQKRRVRASLQRVDPIGFQLRENQKIERRQYNVSRPNALWHIDGHHKLIRWGFVIHGMVDGYSRKIVALHAGRSNSASTVLRLFLSATHEHGEPSRVRGDHGGENIDVALYMVQAKGRNRGSFLWGSSTRNTRIERLWVEVGTQFARRWRAFFTRLEDLHDLDPTHPHHIWLLHTLFQHDINNDCEAFAQDWNAHPIRGEGHDKSPNGMWFLGKLNHGIYVDDCNGLHPSDIRLFYGTTQRANRERAYGRTGAGHPVDELSDGDLDWDDSDSNSESDSGSNEAGETDANEPETEDDDSNITSHIRHDAVPTPKSESPFTSPNSDGVFFELLNQFDEQNVVPRRFKIHPDEWDDQGYPSSVQIKTGRRSGQCLTIMLPHHLWYPRSLIWVQGLHALTLVTQHIDVSNTVSE